MGRGPVRQIYFEKEEEQPGMGWSSREELPIFYCSCQAFASL